MRFNELIPELSVSSLNESLRFYVDGLGFKIEYRRDESQFAFLSLQGSQIMLSQRNGHWETGAMNQPFGRGINFQIMLSSIEPILKSLEALNHPLMKEPWDSWYRKDNEKIGQREFLVQDPDGYLLRFAEKLAEKHQD